MSVEGRIRNGRGLRDLESLEESRVRLPLKAWVVRGLAKGARNLERYARRTDTVPARLLSAISPEPGLRYRRSRRKRVFDVATALAAAPFATAVIHANIKKISAEDGGEPFYLHERMVSKVMLPDGTIDIPTRPVKKLKTLKQGADRRYSPEVVSVLNGKKVNGELDHPDLLEAGEGLRATSLDEVPQVFQVLAGELSMVEIRSMAPDWNETLRDALEAKRPGFHQAWESDYFAVERHGLIHPGAVYGIKDDVRKAFLDRRYARRASLSLDVYYLIAAGTNILEKIAKRVSPRAQVVADNVNGRMVD